MDLQLKDGWIEVITGSMYAGKTEELLRRIKRIDYAKKSIVLFKPEVDNRHKSGKVVSHNNNEAEAIIIKKASDLFNHLTEKPYSVAIDEVQFFDEEVIDVCERLADNGIRVIVAGLDRNFRGEPFGPMPTLLARAEYVTKLNAICQVCGAPATRTQRIIDGKPAHYNDPVILVGAKEHYEARCRHCHIVPGNE